MCEVRNPQKETYRVQNVGLAAAVQSGDGIEKRVEAVDFGPLGVRFKTFDNDGFNVHRCFSRPPETNAREKMCIDDKPVEEQPGEQSYCSMFTSNQKTVV